eukprot:8598903-Pyramimonas_sp.AAC.1
MAAGVEGAGGGRSRPEEHESALRRLPKRRSPSPTQENDNFLYWGMCSACNLLPRPVSRKISSGFHIHPPRPRSR